MFNVKVILNFFFKECKDDKLRNETVVSLLNCYNSADKTMLTLNGLAVDCINKLKSGDAKLKEKYIEYLGAISTFLRDKPEKHISGKCSFLWKKDGSFQKLNNEIKKFSEKSSQNSCGDLKNLLNKVEEDMNKCPLLEKSKEFIMYELRKLISLTCLPEEMDCSHDALRDCIEKSPNNLKYENSCKKYPSTATACLKKKLNNCKVEFVKEAWINLFEAHDEYCKELKECEMKKQNGTNCESEVWNKLPKKNGYAICKTLLNDFKNDKPSTIHNFNKNSENYNYYIQKDLCKYPNYKHESKYKFK